jgi:DnaK suppressor protein
MSTNPLNDISKVYLEQIAESSHKRLDPVGEEDADIDNDNDIDSSDNYLHKRRKAIGKAISKKNVKEGYSNWREELSEVMSVIDKQEKDQKIVEKKVSNKIAINPNMGEAVEGLGGTLIEMVEIDEVDYIVESVYGELLDEGYDEEDIEEALEYALTEAKVTFGHDTPTGEKKRTNLIGALGRLARQKLSSKVRDVKKSARAAVARGARKVAKGALSVARKAEGSDKTPSAAHTKTRSASTYRGAGAGTKEKVSSGSYTPPAKKKTEKPADPWKGSSTVPQKPKPKAEKPSDPWEGSASTPPKQEAKPAAKKPAAKPKATTKTTKVTPKPVAKPAAKASAAKAAPKAAAAKPKAKKKSKLDNLLSDIRNESAQIDEMDFRIDPATHRQQQRIEKATKLQQATKGPESSAAGSAVKRLGGSGISLPLANSYEPSGNRLDEKTLTKKEKSKREKLVKSMKKNLPGFETRYPGRGKEVMYATATKIAKKTV